MNWDVMFLTAEEKRVLKDFDDYLTEWYSGNLEEFQLDSRYKNYEEKISSGDPETLFARKMGGAIAVQLVQKIYAERICDKYVKD